MDAKACPKLRWTDIINKREVSTSEEDQSLREVMLKKKTFFEFKEKIPNIDK